MQTSFPSLAQISSTLENPEPLMSLNGDSLRKLAASLLLQCMVRMERLEKLVVARDPSALSDMPAFPSSSVLSQLNLRQQPSHEALRVIEASSTTMRSLTVKGRNGLRTRYFGPNSTRVLLNLVRALPSLTQSPKKGACKASGANKHADRQTKKAPLGMADRTHPL